MFILSIKCNTISLLSGLCLSYFCRLSSRSRALNPCMMCLLPGWKVSKRCSACSMALILKCDTNEQLLLSSVSLSIRFYCLFYTFFGLLSSNVVCTNDSILGISRRIWDHMQALLINFRILDIFFQYHLCTQNTLFSTEKFMHEDLQLHSYRTLLKQKIALFQNTSPNW